MFNARIHDCLVGFGQGVSAQDYKANIEAIYEAAVAKLAPGGTFLWTTTTPVAQKCAATAECPPECIAIAASVLGGKPHVKFNDLCANVSAICGTNYSIGECPIQRGSVGAPTSGAEHGGMHFNSAGRQFTALVTARSIVAALGPAWARINCTEESYTSHTCSGWKPGADVLPPRKL